MNEEEKEIYKWVLVGNTWHYQTQCHDGSIDPTYAGGAFNKYYVYTANGDEYRVYKWVHRDWKLMVDIPLDSGKTLKEVEALTLLF